METRVEDVREKRQQCNIVKPVRKKKTLKINEITVKSNDSRGTRVAGGQTSARRSPLVFFNELIKTEHYNVRKNVICLFIAISR